MDCAWPRDLAYLCGSSLGRIFLFDDRARRWLDSWDVCVAKNRNGSAYVGLRIWVVPRRPTSIAAFYCTRAQCQLGPQNSTRLGIALLSVLGVLGHSCDCKWIDVMGTRNGAEQNVASLRKTDRWPRAFIESCEWVTENWPDRRLFSRSVGSARRSGLPCLLCKEI